jgi:molybdopterin-guanine dinucleotide biosynthesis protein A
VNGLVAAVLTGGQSRRMGRDKATLPVDGIAMARRVADTALAGGCTDVVAIGGPAERREVHGLAVVADRWPGEGPLGGIATALHAVGAPVLVLACDLAWIDAGTVAAVLAAAAVVDSDVVTAVTDRVQPLCALWRPSALGALERALEAGERSVVSLLAGLSVTQVPVDARALRNVNTPTDLDER